MATSKRSKRTQGRTAPDASAFLDLIDEELAQPRDVVAAYLQALRASKAGTTDADHCQAAMADVIRTRPVVDPDEADTPDRRMMRLARDLSLAGPQAFDLRAES